MEVIKTSASRPFSKPRNSRIEALPDDLYTPPWLPEGLVYIYAGQRAAPLSREINERLHSRELCCWCDTTLLTYLLHWLCCVSVLETRACWVAVGCRLLIDTGLQRIVLSLNFPWEDHKLEHSMLKIDERWVNAEPSARWQRPIPGE